MKPALPPLPTMALPGIGNEKSMAANRKYKFSIIDFLYYAGRTRYIYKWYMPLEAIFLIVFGVIPPFLIMRFLYRVMPSWLMLVLFLGWA